MCETPFPPNSEICQECEVAQQPASEPTQEQIDVMRFAAKECSISVYGYYRGGTAGSTEEIKYARNVFDSHNGLQHVAFERILPRIQKAVESATQPLLEERDKFKSWYEEYQQKWQEENDLLNKAEDERDQLRKDLDIIDAVLARRPALADCNTRYEKVEKACSVAGAADTAIRERDQLRDRVKELEKERDDALSDYRMKGAWECSKCGFVIQKNNIFIRSGTIDADDSPLNEVCPNDGQLMKPLTYKMAYEGLYAQITQRIEAETKSIQERDTLQSQARLKSGGMEMEIDDLKTVLNRIALSLQVNPSEFMYEDTIIATDQLKAQVAVMHKKLETCKTIMKECAQSVGHCMTCDSMSMMGFERANNLMARLKQAIAKPEDAK